MTFSVYILYSSSLKKFYTGASRYSAKRIRQHNAHQSKWTSQADDWTMLWQAIADDMPSARALEKKIKSRGAKRFLRDQRVQVPPEAG